MTWLLALPLVLLVGAIVVASVISDATMYLRRRGRLVDVSLYLVVPTLVGIHARRDR